MRRIVEALITVAIVLAFCEGFWVRGVVSPLVVEGNSMEQTFREGQRVWVNRLAATRRGAVVVLRDPTNAQKLCIKRVLGLPGDEVVIGPSGARVNSEPANWQGAWPVERTWRLGEGELFVVGDNSANSVDSRRWPTAGIPVELVVGQPFGRR
jgi:signal peptidase I